MTLVIDTSVAVRACDGHNGFELLNDSDLVAPPLMWSEFISLVSETRWRGELTDHEANTLITRLQSSPIQVQAPRGLHRQAFAIATDLGWAKTYDAEYVALAKILGCRLVTTDYRLRRGADRLGFVITPDELQHEPKPNDET